MGEGFIVRGKEPIFDTNTYLYNEGDECTTLTGGWTKTAGSYPPTLETSYILGNNNTSTTTDRWGSRYPTNALNITSYNKLWFEISINPAITGTYVACEINISTDVSTWALQDSTSLASKLYRNNAMTTDVHIMSYIDISAISNTSVFCGIKTARHVKLHKMWLEA